jgi:hypothetical protein
VAWKYTTATNYLKEDNVIVPVHIMQEMGLDVADISEPSYHENSEDKKP